MAHAALLMPLCLSPLRESGFSSFAYGNPFITEVCVLLHSVDSGWFSSIPHDRHNMLKIKLSHITCLPETLQLKLMASCAAQRFSIEARASGLLLCLGTLALGKTRCSLEIVLQTRQWMHRQCGDERSTMALPGEDEICSSG